MRYTIYPFLHFVVVGTVGDRLPPLGLGLGRTHMSRLAEHRWSTQGLVQVPCRGRRFPRSTRPFPRPSEPVLEVSELGAPRTFPCLVCLWEDI